MMIYDLLWVVLIYGFFGWCGEVAFAAVKHGKFVNRGFLNGPICPIYGFGVMFVTTLLTPISHNIALLFVGSVLLTSLLEFLTGLILEQLFHEKWWDYSSMRFNIKGYICLEFSLLWGVAATVIVLFIHPSIMWLVGLMPWTAGVILLCVLTAVLITDLVLTLIGIFKLPRRMRAIIEAEAALKRLSDDIGENVANTVFWAGDTQKAIGERGARLKNTLDEKNSELKNTLKSRREELEALKEKYESLTRSWFIQRRITNAFPNLKQGRFKEALQKIRPKNNDGK